MLEYEIRYVYSFGLLPMIGFCKIQLTSINAIYKLAVTEKDMIPSFSSGWKLKILNVTNSFGVTFGVRKFMERTLPSLFAPLMNTKISTYMQHEIKTYIKDSFGLMNYYIHFPAFKNSTFTMSHNFSKFIVGEDKNHIPQLTVIYDQHPRAKYSFVQYDDLHIMRYIKLNLANVMEILKFEGSLVKNALLTMI